MTSKGDSQMSARTRFLHLGIAVEDGTVRVWPKPPPTIGQVTGLQKRPAAELGPLAGLHAEVTDGTASHRVGAAVAGGAVFLPLALVGLSRKSKAVAFVIGPGGVVHERPLKGARQIREAQAEAVRFNAMAGSA
jgi:hypothetical protein